MKGKPAKHILAALAGAALLLGCTRTEPETVGAASLTARIAEDRRAYEIVEDTGEIAGSLAADVARDCGHGFLLEPPDRAAGL